MSGAIRTEALSAWHALGGTLTRLREEGNRLPCWSDPAPFVSDDHGERAEAAEACGSCPAVAACQRFAEANAEPARVWGGVDRTPRTYERKSA